VRWQRRSKEESDDSLNDGLAAFPSSYIRRSDFMDSINAREMLANTTVTKVAGCPHGGPIAAMTLPILGASSDAAFGTTEIRIMTNSGHSLANIECPPRGLSHIYTAADIMTMGFTDRTVLIVVLRDSLSLTYDLSGNQVLPPFHILPSSESGKGTDLLQACVYEGGVAVLSMGMQAAIAEFLDDHDASSYGDEIHLPTRKIFPSSSPVPVSEGEGTTGGLQAGAVPQTFAIVSSLPTMAFASSNFFSYVSIAILPRFHTTSRHPEVFLSTSDNSVVVVNTVTGDITDVDCRARILSPIVAMTFAPNGRFLACFTQSSILTVISTSFETKVLDFDTSEGSSSPPLDMKWCGEDSVVLHWKNLGVLMVGPYGDWLRFPFVNVENLYIIPEIDCCRVITDSAVELLQRVPPATAMLLRIGSIEPSAMLLEASDSFEAGSPASDEDARAITKTGMLLEAVDTCTDAATREFEIEMQKRLLKAASFGMHFAYKESGAEEKIMGGRTSGDVSDELTMPSQTAIKFVAAARKLRILNALRNPTVGFVLTATQFEHITITGVIARLIAMKRPALATSISKYLGLPKSIQLFARASKAAALVTYDSGQTDAEIAEAAIRIINENADGEPGDKKSIAANSGAYAMVALAASRAGRPGVSNLLLMLESSVTDKVPALISAGSFADAMAVATSARDTDFIFYTLMECEKACMSAAKDPSAAQSSFFGTVISKFTPEGFNTLRTYLETTADVKNVVNLLLRATRFVDAGLAMAGSSMDNKLDPQDKQSKLMEASRVFGLGKDAAFHKACTDEYIDLLGAQEILRNKYGAEDVAVEGLSVTETIVSLIRHAAVNKREAHRLLADVDKLGKKFRVPEKRMWHIKVKAFAENGEWENLRSLGDSKAKSPIGFKPFARVAIKGKLGVAEVTRYIEKVTIPEERYDLFCEAELWKSAVTEATKMRDPQRVANVRALCDSEEIQEQCNKTLSRLGAA
jgi:hypothetical protein